MSKKQKITVGQILDLVDYNRNGEGMTIKISESDDNWSITQTNSVMLEMIKDFEVDSITGDEDGVAIWLHGNSISEFWEKVRERNKAAEK